MKRAIQLGFVIVLLVSSMFENPFLYSAQMSDYCVIPPIVSSVAPPLVLFVAGRDHKLFYEAYNDAFDLDGDGKLDTTYDHSITYYGYFDPYKCYEYQSSGQKKFVPVSTTSDKFCTENQWSGNILNWLTMSRIDVLRKVLYGGYRKEDSANETVLERSFIPQDAHSWGKEYTGRLCFDGTKYGKMCSLNIDCGAGSTCVDVSESLIGMSAPPGACTAAETYDYTPGVILVVKYSHSSNKSDNEHCGTNHSYLLSSYEPGNYEANFYITDMNSTYIDPNKDNSPDYSNFFAVAEFEADVTGNWQFAIDGNEGVELEIQTIPGSPGNIVASYYGCHNRCDCQTYEGSIALTANNWYRLIVRHTEKKGKDGFKVWYKKPGATSWTVFGNTLNIRAPYIEDDNTCALTSTDFINYGTPGTGEVLSGPISRHLFCNTSLGDGPSHPPLLRMLQSKTKRIWEWVSKERPVCDGSLGTPTDYEVRVQVCNQSIGLEANCKFYPSSGGIYKPVGLLQKYGEGDGSKVCSKTIAKSCNTDSDCNPATEGLCVENAKMFYGLITGSYEKNTSGGVLRKNIWTILDETNAQTGIFQTSESEQGNIIRTFDGLRITGFRYSDYSYQGSSGGNCGWITSHPLQEGECKNWGNPIAEMVYEGLRYFSGKGTPTTDFIYQEGGSTDASLGLKRKGWGIKKGSNTYQPYDIFPSCSKPFLVILSDVNTSYDSDKVPGSYFSSFSGDLPDLDVSEILSQIGDYENINGNSYFIGATGNNTDFICSGKEINNFSQVRGLCPEEPTKHGSYYVSAVSHYGKTQFLEKTGKPNVTTFSVALASPVADLRIKVGDNYVSMVPFGKSVSGCYAVYESCAQKCTLSPGAFGLTISNCSSGAFCPTNQIVDYYVDTILYDDQKNVTYAKFRVNFEDVEQGADHDMDAIILYEICTGSSCEPAIENNQLKVKLTSQYAAGCIDQVLGFVISGTTEDGAYLPVKDKDVPGTSDGDTPAVVANMPLSWEKIFTVAGSGAGFLKDPLWYAAKWGGFEDKNGNNVPDQSDEWDRYDNNTGNLGSDGLPDTYFKVVNPLKMEAQLERVFAEILRKAASGTAASVLSTSEGQGANLLQAVFYPRRAFGDVEIDWTGEIQNLWYYVDPFIGKSSIRDDWSNGGVPDKKLSLTEDRVVNFYFDTSDSKTKVKLYKDTDGDGTGDTYDGTVDIDDVVNLWKAGRKLFERDITTDPRTIYTTIDGQNMLTGGLSVANASTLKAYLDVPDDDTAEKIIRYVHGEDQQGLRNRTVTIGGITNTWKLGDVVSSTPKVQSSVRLNTYHMFPPLGYSDDTYYQFISSRDYKTRGVVYAGTNDGLLHAFKLGTLDVTGYTDAKARLCQENSATLDGECDETETGTDELGKELWAFVPKHSLPYLKYLTDPDYCHIFYVDFPVYIFDASINKPASCTESSYTLCTKKTELSGNYLNQEETSWRTILIGGMGIGGACRKAGSSCTDCVKTPTTDPSDSSKGLGYSSYFALDVTNPLTPTLLWEFADPDLGYATSGPAVIRIGDRDKNGSWFVVFASGPTGPIQDFEFKGRSDQTLKLFVLDLKTGQLLRKIDTGIQYAFGGSLFNSAIDIHRGSPLSDGFYQDDAIYFGYTVKSSSCGGGNGEPCNSGEWTSGGVIRLLTKEDPDPNNWVWSKVIEGIGPVNASVVRLQDRKNKQLWLLFGTGRYFYKTDDPGNRRSLYGVLEGLYTVNNTIDYSATTDVLSRSDLKDQTSEPSTQLPSDKKGWYIDMDAASGTQGAERMITDPLALPTGVVYFTTFSPNTDVCSMGGNTYLWAVNFSTGSAPNPSQVQGKALLQVSTGAIEEIDLPQQLTQAGGRKTSAFTGIPPKGQGLALVVRPRPLSKFMHIKRR